MKSLLTIFTLVFTMMFSSTSFAEWTRVTEGLDGTIFYVDFERIRKVDGYVYFWDLSNRLKPSEGGNLSVAIYKQGDCKLFRHQRLSYVFYKGPMGGGASDVQEPEKTSQGWNYPLPNSVDESILQSVCSW